MAPVLTTCRRILCTPRRAAIAVALMLLVAMTGAYVVGRSSVATRVDTAVTDAGGPVDLKQDSALLRAERAKSLFEQREFEKGTAELRVAIRLNPGDAGQECDLTPKVALSDAALRHGEVQVKQMLQDRPAMARRASPGGFLWKWAARKFAGEDAGMLVDWSPNDPTPFDGNVGGGVTTHAWVQVRKSDSGSPDLNCDAEWSWAVCQLYGAAARKTHRGLNQRAKSGALDCDAYVLEMLLLDERARQYTRSFYLEHYLPLFDLEKVETSPTAWHCFAFTADKGDLAAIWRGTARWHFHSDWFKLLSMISATARRDEASALRGIASLETNRARLSSEQLETFHYVKAQRYEIKKAFLAALKEVEAAEHFSPTSTSVPDVRARILHRAVLADQITVSDLDRLLEQEPDSPLLHAVRGRLHFQKRECDLGSKDVLDSIQLNPGDVGQNYEPSTKAELSAEALLHGEGQIKAMLRDRPSMAEHVTEGDELWKWTVRKFAGEDGELVDWSPASPAPHEARCIPSTATQRAQINVRPSPINLVGDKSGEFNRLWAYAVFELHNLTHAGKSSEVTRQAWEGAMDRDTYITTMLEREQFAVQSALAFFLKKYLPFMRAKAVNVSPDIWHCFTFYMSESARSAHWKASGSWDYYSTHYDRLIAHRAQVNRGQLLGLPTASQAMASEDSVRLLNSRESAPQTIEALILPSQAIGNITLPEPSPKSAVAE